MKTLSVQNKKWRLAPACPDAVDALAQTLNVSPLIAQLLVNRDIKTPEEGNDFVARDLTRLHDPFLMTGMQAAVERVVAAIESGEQIRVFCDYDVDGVTSAAFLTHFFRDLGVAVNYYLPDRMEEGYGLNEQAVRKIRDEGCTLMITADCGITGVKEVQTANAIGLDVIVSDHHQVGPEGLPPAVAVLNPHRPDCQYPFRFLSGVGIVFKLATAIRSALHRRGWKKEALPNLKRHLDLFVLGTIADVAPLTGENHILSSHGLEMMAATTKPGLVALKDVAGVNGRVDSRSVGFALGPRLNAAGRLGKADAGLHLLTANDLNAAKDIAKKVDAINTERKEIQGWALEEAEYLIEREVDLDNDRVLVLASENFHPGVIGIVASRLVEKHYRPTVLIALADGVGKGSGRSIPKFNLYKAFCECAEHFLQFGGHAYAAGLTIKEENIDAFRQTLNAIGQRFLAADDLIQEIEIDSELPLADIDTQLFKKIHALEPFGAQNPVPLFLSRNVRIRDFRFMGKDESHIRFKAIQDKAGIDAVGFNLAEAFEAINVEEDRVDLVYELATNAWSGRDKVELRLLDARLSTEETA